MSPLSAAEVLEVWEKGLDQSLLEKTLHLLAKASSTGDLLAIGELSIGERDARLLQLREWMFGPILKNVACCPQCHETVEWESRTSDFRVQEWSDPAIPKKYPLNIGDPSITFRLINTRDIVRAIRGSYSSDHRRILTQCIMGSNGVNVPGLNDQLLTEICSHMGELDRQAEVILKIHCPSCAHAWDADFNIVTFLWAEINSWAGRMMQEVCHLAHAFGWREQDILSMSPRRRQLYLQMIGR